MAVAYRACGWKWVPGGRTRFGRPFDRLRARLGAAGMTVAAGVTVGQGVAARTCFAALVVSRTWSMVPIPYMQASTSTSLKTNSKACGPR